MKKLLISITAIFLLTACGSRWDVDVDLTPEETQAIKTEIQSLKTEIQNFVPPTSGEIAWRQYIDLSQAYEKIGQMDNAIKVYTDVLDSGVKTKAIIHNLGRLYEKVEEYDLAVEQYQCLIDEYFDNNYLYDITWAYIRAKNRKEAEKYFNAWQLEFKKTDSQTQQAIKKLREEEKGS